LDSNGIIAGKDENKENGSRQEMYVGIAEEIQENIFIS